MARFLTVADGDAAVGQERDLDTGALLVAAGAASSEVLLADPPEQLPAPVPVLVTGRSKQGEHPVEAGHPGRTVG